MATLPELMNYDAGRTIQFGEAGQKRKTLAEIGGFASQGDFKGAQAAAFAGGETEMGLHIKGMNDQDQQRLVGQAASWAYQANDPQKWEQGRKQWLDMGYDIGPFQSREALISQATTIQDRMSQANADRTYNLAASKDAREASASAGGVFGGNSVEAQSLNYLIQQGKISPEQAAQLGAGKTVTGPGGEVIFMTPQGVFGGGGQQSGQPGAPPGGAPPQQSGMIPITQPKMTEGQSNAALYADRMRSSNSTIGEHPTAGTNLYDRTVSNAPFGLGNYAVSDEYRATEQAERDFINATLRRESGAVISPQEFDNARKQYFPQPGDDPNTLSQKERNRQMAIDGISRAAGAAYQPKGGGQPVTINGYTIEQVD